MSTSKSRRNLSIAAVSSIIIVSASTLLFKTYPHLKPDTSSLLSKIKSYTKTDSTATTSPEQSSEDDESNLLGESTVVVTDRAVSQWTEDELLAFLKEKEISVPEGSTFAELVSLVSQIQSN
ncbi:hypothetical protein CANARDRAFT_5479 [[Candida] arabinofermentans NRRL YB-2248]|uniref:Uncharacterized protein n=1 Tax=[Candida] arabinofermentans NRRL YB-2248 TaxID=983967 RepID=A0A1E4T8U5_9ASCO|nr:hypothetical protein CANARDRAFT_5479 [[Candida] arabinofermentans NRRL YB-2248]